MVKVQAVAIHATPPRAGKNVVSVGGVAQVGRLEATAVFVWA
jgi:hypothetical protein